MKVMREIERLDITSHTYDERDFWLSKSFVSDTD